MFGWLANLLIRAPISGSGCACCEAKKEQLRQMQKAILSEDEADCGKTENSCGAGECPCRYETGSSAIDMTVSTHYKL